MKSKIRQDYSLQQQEALRSYEVLLRDMRGQGRLFIKLIHTPEKQESEISYFKNEESQKYCKKT